MNAVVAQAPQRCSGATHVQLRGGTPRKLFVFEAEVTLAADI
jgi:hypothetical protein